MYYIKVNNRRILTCFLSKFRQLYFLFNCLKTRYPITIIILLYDLLEC